jgi:hypothetical protein
MTAHDTQRIIDAATLVATARRLGDREALDMMLHRLAAAVDAARVPAERPEVPDHVAYKRLAAARGYRDEGATDA